VYIVFFFSIKLRSELLTRKVPLQPFLCKPICVLRKIFLSVCTSFHVSSGVSRCVGSLNQAPSDQRAADQTHHPPLDLRDDIYYYFVGAHIALIMAEITVEFF